MEQTKMKKRFVSMKKRTLKIPLNYVHDLVVTSSVEKSQ